MVQGSLRNGRVSLKLTPSCYPPHENLESLQKMAHAFVEEHSLPGGPCRYSETPK